MPKVVFTEVEKALLEVLDGQGPVPIGKAFEEVNQEFAPQPLEVLKRTTTELVRTGYIRGGLGSPSPVLILTEKGTRVIVNDFEEELVSGSGHDSDEEEELLVSQVGLRRRAQFRLAE